MFDWLPVLQRELTPLVLPRTTLIERVGGPVDTEAYLSMCVAHGLDCDPDRRDRWEGEHAPAYRTLVPMVAAAAEPFGFPYFLRTDVMSCKHDWLDTCYIGEAENLERHVYNLIEGQAMRLMWGEAPFRGFAVREFLEADAPFVAFNGMPVAREFRVFVNGAKTECVHAYWDDEENIRRGLLYPGQLEPSVDWRKALHTQSQLDEYTQAYLEAHASDAGKALGGAWSIDFMWARRRGEHNARWWLIDVAPALDSWHPGHEE